MATLFHICSTQSPIKPLYVDSHPYCNIDKKLVLFKHFSIIQNRWHPYLKMLSAVCFKTNTTICLFILYIVCIKFFEQMATSQRYFLPNHTRLNYIIQKYTLYVHTNIYLHNFQTTFVVLI